MAAETKTPGPSAPAPGTAGARSLPEPFTLVIFGASGDLTARKLMPAVFSLFRAGLLPEKFSLLGYARTPKSDEEFRLDMRDGVARSLRGAAFDEAKWSAFAARLGYVTGAYDDPAGFLDLKRRLEEVAARNQAPANRLFYLATPPDVFVPIVRALQAAGLSSPGADRTPWARIIIEKPFGRDLATARALDAEILKAFQEPQVFRIDHYLGKETVQNLLVLRFANSIFEPIWNHHFVNHVQITVAETVGVERRGPYYDQSGALRDIVQNHLLQLVGLVAMEPPVALAPNAIRDEKVKVLRALRPMAPSASRRASSGPSTPAARRGAGPSPAIARSRASRRTPPPRPTWP